MRGVNKVILFGRATRDAELAYTPSGLAILKFGIATNRVEGKGAEKKEVADFFDIVFFDKRAEALHSFRLKKGEAVYVEGALRIRDYEDRNNQKRRAVEIIGDEFEVAPRPRREDQAGEDGERQPSPPPAAEPAATTAAAGDGFDDDIPF